MEYEIYHAGVKGMRWGVRRYQNKDGSLTPAGRKRYTNKDGTLNEKGKKYLAKEEARLKDEKKQYKNQQRTDAKLDKLDQMRRENELLKNKKTSNVDDESDAQTPRKKTTSEMDDRELQERVNRLRNEDAYRDLNKKLGYDDGPKTEMDYKIAELKKQKEYLELQRDISNLTPKKVSLGKKIATEALNDVIVPAAKKAGKEYLEKVLSKAAADALGKTAGKQASKINNTVKDAAKKAAADQAKKQQKADKKAAKKAEKEEAKRQARDEKKAAKEETKNKQTDSSDNIKFTVEGEGTSSRSSTSNTSGSKKSGDVIDADYWYSPSSTVTSIATTTNVSSGRNYISSYANTPIRQLPSPSVAGYLPPPSVAGYLPAPKDDD